MLRRILVTGALGQIGSELMVALRQKYGTENVIASDLRSDQDGKFEPFIILDVLDKNAVMAAVKKYQINVIYHLAAILSANGEKNPQLCWNINVNGLYNILEIGRELQLKQIICPSSIAAFGPETPKENTPQDTILLPKTIYGITKVAGELLADYYITKFGLDVRGLRYPGIISSNVLPGGGTTDYAVEIFYEAILHKKYICFLNHDTMLPMMYLPDALRGTIELSEADLKKLKHHSNFNFAGFSTTPAELAAEIKKYIPKFEIEYHPDFRQEIANSWPRTINDDIARQEWGWHPNYDLAKMTKDMIEKLLKKLKIKN